MHKPTAHWHPNEIEPMGSLICIGEISFPLFLLSGMEFGEDGAALQLEGEYDVTLDPASTVAVLEVLAKAYAAAVASPGPVSAD